MEALEPVLRDLGETPGSEQDIVSPDAAELAALEFGKVALVARDSASLDADAVPRPGTPCKSVWGAVQGAVQFQGLRPSGE